MNLLAICFFFSFFGVKSQPHQQFYSNFLNKGDGDECQPPNDMKPGDRMPDFFRALFQIGPNDDLVFDSCGLWFIDIQHNYAGYPVYNSYGAEWFRAVYDRKANAWTPVFPERAHLTIDTLPNATDVQTKKPSKQDSVDACRNYLKIPSSLPVAHVNRYVVVYDTEKVDDLMAEVGDDNTATLKMPKDEDDEQPGIYNPVLADHVMIWKKAPKLKSTVKQITAGGTAVYPWYSCFYDTFAKQAMNVTFKIRALFYLVTPGETSPKSLDAVPDLVNSSFPYLFALIFLELVFGIAFKKRRDFFQINDAITSMTAGVFSRLPDLFSRTIELVSYIWVYEHFHIFSLQSDSILTWVFTLLAFDFAYYWFHRAAHEVNLFWAMHQTHHSSEFCNLSTATRQALLQKYCSFMFYLPIALFVPPPIFAMHVQLNLLYQFWLHTEIVGRLWWPIELVFNTASHHRVHHGRNPYCIDKNYAGFLIIWDRIFGTFQAELDEERVVFGLVHNVKSFDPFYVQFNHFEEIWQKFWKSNAISVFKTFFYGPGWNPEKASIRLGDPKDLPEIEANPTATRFNPRIAKWVQFYCLVHFTLAALSVGYVLALPSNKRPPFYAAVTLALGFLASAFSFGNIFNRRTWLAPKFEMARCLVFALFSPWLCQQCGVKSEQLEITIQLAFTLSILPWLIFNQKIV